MSPNLGESKLIKKQHLLGRFKLNSQFGIGLILAVSVGLVFLFLLQKPYYQDLNYTFLIASAFLQGHLGITDARPWLNELVPMPGGIYYSVFPLGAVLSVLPLSALVALGWVSAYPVNALVVFLASGCAALSYGYTFAKPNFSTLKRLILATWLVVGTWFMTNMLFAGAWQLALGFAVLGQLAALYWSVVRPRPLLAGLGLAIAFGNRTEVILTAPIILTFLLRPHWQPGNPWREFIKHTWLVALRFALIPASLGLATLMYNYARFGSITDFGYSRIPGLLSEPLYRQGFFSFLGVPENAHQMLWQGWRHIQHWPYLVPTGWGGSILLASPFLLLLFRRPAGNRLRITLSWLAIVALTFSLWAHGNPGGWQYSYRYALILVPWLLVLLVEYLPAKVTRIEATLWLVSVITSFYATYLFMWTDYLNS